MIELIFVLQKEYLVAKPARDAAAKAKREAEASLAPEGPLHDDNEWNIRYSFIAILTSILAEAGN